MEFNKQKALNLAKDLADKFNPEEIQKFIEKHKDLEFIEDVKTLFSMAVDSIKGKYKRD